MKNQKLILTGMLVLVFALQAFGEILSTDSEKVAMTSISTIAMNVTIQQSNHLDIYVLGDEKIAKNLKKFKGQQIGDVSLRSIKYGTELPKKKPSVLILADKTKCEEVINYCRANKVLSITNIPDLCTKGISLGIGCSSKPIFENKYSLRTVVIYLNESASLAEGMVWHENIKDVTTEVETGEILALYTAQNNELK